MCSWENMDLNNKPIGKKTFTIRDFFKSSEDLKENDLTPPPKTDRQYNVTVRHQLVVKQISLCLLRLVEQSNFTELLRNMLI